MSELVITPNIARKTAKAAGAVCAGEKVSVTLKGCAALDTETLRLRVTFMNRTLAVFPVPPVEGEAQTRFTVSGEDLSCTLNLCTVQMLRLFRCACEMEVLLVLDDVAESVRQVYFLCPAEIRGWPMEKGADVPIDLSGYVDRIAKVEERISDAEAEIDADIKAVNVRISEHARDAERHITAAERSAWNGVAGKQDVIVQDGFLYVPDRDREGVWRRLQAFYDAEMGGVTTTCGDAAYVRGEDGGFVLDDSEEES